MRRRRRRARGTATVEFVLIIPVVVVIIAAIGYFREGYVTEIKTLHHTETETWRIAMSNDRGVCGSNARHVFSGVPLGEAGDAAREVAAMSMRQWSFLYVNGGVRREETQAIPPPLGPLHGRWTRTHRADYMPCNETVGGNDGALPGAFDALWTRYVSP